MAITSSSLPGSGFETIDAANTYLESNGYYLFQADFTFPSIDWSGDGWITLKNACTTGGCSDGAGVVFWDENDGPSLARHNTVGAIGSQAFTLDGSGTGPVVPEPSSFLLLGSGLAGLAGLLKRKLKA
jgi:hypothetical protein